MITVTYSRHFGRWMVAIALSAVHIVAVIAAAFADIAVMCRIHICFAMPFAALVTLGVVFVKAFRAYCIAVGYSGSFF